MRRSGTPLLLAAGLCVAACNDSVLFVTSTGINLGYDTAPPSIDLGYNRTEGYTGPAYSNGALPPVVGRIQSNLDVFSPVVRQTYATGPAAELLTKPDADSTVKDHQFSSVPLVSNSRRVAYFGTESTVGLRVSFTGPTASSGIPSSVALGYRRKELSWIPVTLAKANSGCVGSTVPTPRLAATVATVAAQNGVTPESIEVDCYGSTLANIVINGSVATAGQPNASLLLDQFIATGVAAENLAADTSTADSKGILRSVFRSQLRPLGADTSPKGIGSAQPDAPPAAAAVPK